MKSVQRQELLPAGTEKALAVMAPGLHFESPARQRHHEVALELGCGRGRAALHLFLAGATVLGVELALERYSFAVEAMQRLAHRCPEAFRVSFQTSKAWQEVLQVRQGDFFQLVDREEIAAATLIFLQAMTGHMGKIIANMGSIHGRYENSHLGM
eukprot:s1390_g4.t1